MKATALIERLQHIVDQSGDQDVFMDIGPNGLIEIAEVDEAASDEGIILWPKDGEG